MVDGWIICKDLLVGLWVLFMFMFHARDCMWRLVGWFVVIYGIVHGFALPRVGLVSNDSLSI